jgi:DNA polymerase-3 subunit alpha
LGKWHFPPVDLPAGKNVDEVLRTNAENGLRSLVPEVTEDMCKRLDYELDIIKTKGYSPYFLAVADYVKWARANNIITTTRGSAAGSLVSFSIGITTVNPLFFKLPFERFLNPYRPSPPDIDMDFADNRRDEVIAYAVQKYGKEKVAQIITFGTMAARGSVRDVGRALGFSYSFCDQIAKMIPMGNQGFPMTLKKALQTTPELYALYNNNEDVKRLWDVAQKIEGCARHTSVHAAGVVISPTDLTDFTPVQYETGGTQIVTQYEMHAVEDAGVLKMDFLGIRNLSILGDATKIVEKTRGVKVDLLNIPWDDKLTYEKLARGQTIGLFQLGGSGMTRYLEELKPSNIFDIMAMVALYRPGPMESIPEFIRRKHNPALIRYLDPRMKDYLDTSYGVITFQDDVLLTAINIAGYNWEEADKLRKAMGKKIPEEMAKQKEKFLSGCLKNGLKQSQANELWSLIEPFAAYGFNKAHAASYAVVAYQTAYMKAHYPEEFMAAVLSAEAGDMDKVSEIVQECKDMEMEVLPPDVNESFELFAVVPNRPKLTIRFGLQAVKNVGAHIAEVIIHERKANGSYKDLEDFLSRVKDKDLIKCGALDRFGERGVLLGNIEALTAFVRDNQKEIASNQNSLFNLATTGPGRLHLKPMPPIVREDQLAWEKELIGLYISDHPFSEFARALGKNFPRIATLFAAKPAGNWVVVCGLVSGAKRIITKKGDAMLFVTLEDATGQVEVVFFPKIFENYKTALNPGTTICLVAKYSDREGEKKLLAEKLEVVTKENIAEIKERFGNFLKSSTQLEEPEQALVVEIPGVMLPEKKEKLKKLFKDNPGATKVYLLVGNKKLDINLSVNPTPQFQEELKEILR